MNETLLLSGAEQDMFGHYCRLEEQREGAGSKFDEAIHEYLRLLRQNPFLGPRYPAVHQLRRRVVLEWDVAIYYSVEGRRNVIHAVLHLRQDAMTIRSILLSRLPQ
jgi:plasmid stabilization system protein ParE